MKQECFLSKLFHVIQLITTTSKFNVYFSTLFENKTVFMVMFTIDVIILLIQCYSILYLNISLFSRIFDSSYVLSCGHDFKLAV